MANNDTTGFLVPSAIADISGLQTALNGKSASNHNHTGTYALSSHTHSGVYAVVDHTHYYATSIASSVEPTSPVTGDLWWDGTALKFYDGVTWNATSTSGGIANTVDSVLGSNGNDGDLWTVYNSNGTGEVYVWSDYASQYLSGGWLRASIKHTIDYGEPATAVVGDLWTDLTTNSLKYYDGVGWTAISTGAQYSYNAGTPAEWSPTGNLYINSLTHTLYWYDGELWNEVSGGSGNSVQLGAGTPEDVTLAGGNSGDIYFETNAPNLYFCDGSGVWRLIPSGRAISSSDPPPTMAGSNSSNGDLWIQQTDSRLYFLNDIGTMTWQHVPRHHGDLGIAPSVAKDGDTYWDTMYSAIFMYAGGGWRQIS